MNSPATFHSSGHRPCVELGRDEADTNWAKLQFELVSDVACFNNLASDWDRLFRSARGKSLQFQSYTLISRWLAHFGETVSNGQTELAMLLGYHRNDLVMVWPMVIERRLGLKVLRWAGDPIAQYGDVLVAECEAAGHWLRTAVDYLQKNVPADIISLSGLRCDGVLASELKRLGFAPATTDIAREVKLDQFVDITDFRSRFSRKTRRFRRRSNALLEEQGPVSFHVHRNGTEKTTHLRKAIQFKVNWLAERGQISRAFLDDRFAKFWLDFASMTCSSNEVLISELRCADETVAVEVGLLAKSHYVAYIGALNPKFANYSPGALQMERTIEHLHALGIETYDLLPPDDDYKRRWADAEFTVESFVIANSSLGQAYKALRLHALKGELKSRFAQLPLSVRQSIASVIPEVIGRK